MLTKLTTQLAFSTNVLQIWLGLRNWFYAVDIRNYVVAMAVAMFPYGNYGGILKKVLQ